MKFAIWHAECQDRAEADIVEADSATAAAKTCLFVYYAGDCDHGADRVEQETPTSWLAFRKGSPDYFHVEQLNTNTYTNYEIK